MMMHSYGVSVRENLCVRWIAQSTYLILSCCLSPARNIVLSLMCTLIKFPKLKVISQNQKKNAWTTFGRWNTELPFHLSKDCTHIIVVSTITRTCMWIARSYTDHILYPFSSYFIYKYFDIVERKKNDFFASILFRLAFVRHICHDNPTYMSSFDHIVITSTLKFFTLVVYIYFVPRAIIEHVVAAR